jgi:hypothetical protein
VGGILEGMGVNPSMLGVNPSILGVNLSIMRVFPLKIGNVFAKFHRKNSNLLLITTMQLTKKKKSYQSAYSNYSFSPSSLPVFTLNYL